MIRISTCPTPCDCLNDCGDDPRLGACQVTKCAAAIAREAGRRAAAWQRCEAWLATLPAEVDRASARLGWHAALRRR